MSTSRIAVGLPLGTAPPLRQSMVLARAARLMRVDSLWAISHFMSFFPEQIWDKDFSWMAKKGSSPHAQYDWQTFLGYMAPRVGRTQLGVGVTDPISRHPVLLAQAAMTLSHMTRSAPILGLGAGEAENLVPYGFDFSHPVSKLEEAVQIIRLCLHSRGPIDFEGRHYTLRRAVMDLQPAPGRTPRIWIAAHGPRMLRITGRYADGWYPTYPETPETYAQKLAAVRNAAARAGRDPDEIVPALQLFFVVAKDRRTARAMLDTKALRFYALLAPDEIWARYGLSHPLGEGFRGIVDFVPTAYDRAALEDAIAQVDPEMVASLLPWGTPGDIVDHIRALGDAGLRHVVLAPMSGLLSRRAAGYALRATRSIVRSLRTGSA